jgi:hypothetical protein
MIRDMPFYGISLDASLASKEKWKKSQAAFNFNWNGIIDNPTCLWDYWQSYLINWNMIIDNLTCLIGMGLLTILPVYGIIDNLTCLIGIGLLTILPV